MMTAPQRSYSPLRSTLPCSLTQIIGLSIRGHASTTTWTSTWAQAGECRVLVQRPDHALATACRCRPASRARTSDVLLCACFVCAGTSVRPQIRYAARKTASAR